MSIIFNHRTGLIEATGGSGVVVKDSTGADTFTMRHDGTFGLLTTNTGSMYLQPNGSNALELTSTVVRVMNGRTFRIDDSGNTDYVDFTHDGTDFNIAGTNTTDLNITGITNLTFTGRIFGAGPSVSFGNLASRGALHVDLANNTSATNVLTWNQLDDGSDGGLQVLNQGNQIRLYNTSGDYLGLTSAGVNFNGTLLTSGGISGTVANDQVVVGTGSSTVDSSANFTFDGSSLEVNANANAPSEVVVGESSTLRGDAQDGRLVLYSEQTGAITSATLTNTGTNLQIAGTVPTMQVNVNADIIGGHYFQIRDTGNTDNVRFQHDGTDFNITGTNTTDINITGITSIQAGTVDADFDAITATSYGGITEANLLDKTATETISGNYTVNSTGSLRVQTSSNTSPLIIQRTTTDAEAISLGADDTVAHFRYDNDEISGTLRFTIDNADTETGGGVGANTTVIDFYADNSQPLFDLQDGTALRIRDSGDTDYVQMSHDGTDFNIVGTNTTDINITGITSIQAGTVDADFDVVSATEYEGQQGGSQSNPTYTFTGDTNTGIYNPSADELSLSVGATRKIQITTSLTTFDQAISVSGTITGNGITSTTTVTADEFTSTADQSQPWLTLNSTSSGDNWTAQGAGISVGESGKKGQAAIHMTYNGDGSGYVGMGTVDDTAGTGGRPGAGHFDFTYNNHNILVGGRLFPGLDGGTTQATRYLDTPTAYGSVNVAGTTTSYAGYSINNDIIFMSNGTTHGLFNAGSSEWIIQNTDNSAVSLFHNNSTRLATTSAGVSVTGTMTASGTIYPGGQTVGGIKAVAGNYGSVTATGADGSSGSYAGWSVNDTVVLMASGSTAGIYDDTNNEWKIRHDTDNTGVELYYNGAIALSTVLRSTTGNTSSATILDHAGVTRDVGFNHVKEVSMTTANITLDDIHAGTIIRRTGTSAVTLTVAAGTAFPVGSMVTVLNHGTGGSLTISDGAEAMYIMNGSGTVTDSAGFVLAIGGCITIWRQGTSAFYVWGAGIP